MIHVALVKSNTCSKKEFFTRTGKQNVTKSPISSSTITNVKQCRRMCRLEKQCLSFNFIKNSPDDGTCELFADMDWSLVDESVLNAEYNGKPTILQMNASNLEDNENIQCHESSTKMSYSRVALIC